MKVYEAVAKSLEELGFKYAYTIPGTHIYHLNHSLGIIQRVFRHEMGVTFAADAYGRIAGKPGLAIVTAGPGILNGLSGLGQAYAEASPLLYITGETRRDEWYGFHGVDKPLAITYSSSPVSKAVYILGRENPSATVRNGYYEALRGRRGPVHISIPYDVLLSDAVETGEGEEASEEVDTSFIQKILVDRFSSGKNLLLIGPEAYSEVAGAILETLDDWIYIASIAQVGMGGHYIERYAGHIEKTFQIHPTAEKAVEEAEKILAIGLPENSPETALIRKVNPHIEIDVVRPSTVAYIMRHGAGYTYYLPLESLPKIIGELETSLSLDVEELNRRRVSKAYEAIKNEMDGPIHQGYIAYTLSQLDIDGYIITCDTGGNEQWIREFIPVSRRVRYLYSGGFGSIGYSLPASIGAYDAGEAYRGVLAIAGDGSLMMSLGELKTLVENKMPVKVIVFNDSRYGILEMLSRSDIGERIDGSIGYVDFSRIAEAMGMEAIKITEAEEVENGLRDALRSSGPILVDIVSSGEEVPTLLRNNL